MPGDYLPGGDARSASREMKALLTGKIGAMDQPPGGGLTCVGELRRLVSRAGQVGRVAPGAPEADHVALLVQATIDIESARCEIARAERSALDPQAQPLQDLLDRLIYRLAGQGNCM